MKPIRSTHENSHITLETITPQIARAYLDTMHRNRRVYGRHLDTLTTEIKRGRWDVNGETIKFDVEGHLIDGQHRLLAVIKADTPIQSYVIQALPTESRDSIDLGLKRSPGDILGLHGYEDATNLAASARWIWRYDNQLMGGYRVTPSIETLKTVLECHPDLQNSLRYGALTSSYVTRSLGSALHCLTSECDPGIAEELFTKLKDGENLNRTNPIYQLRQRLITNANAKARLKNVEVAALVIKTFNARRAGKSVQYLRWITVGNNTEPFPVIT